MHRADLVVHRAANAVHQRALARSIRPDEPNALAGVHRETDPAECDEAAEALAQIVDDQKVGHFHHRALNARPRPTMPSGARTTKPISRMPTMNRFTAGDNVTVATCCS